MSEHIELDKLRVIWETQRQFDEDEPDFFAELKDAAWNVLHENAGYGYDEWVQTLIEEYPAEVVDALGLDPEEAYQGLSDLWDSGEYEDEMTGENHRFKEWAEYFNSERSIELYDLLADSRREIKALRRFLKERMSNPSP